MKSIIHTLLPAFLSVLLCGCHSSTQTKTYADSIYTPAHASGFSILRADNDSSVIIEVYNPWQGAAGVTERLLIDRSGGRLDLPDVTARITGSARRVVVMSSTAVAMLDAIDKSSYIVGVSGLRFISTQSVIGRGEAIKDVGYDGNIDYETLIALKPDIVIVYGVGGPSTMKQKLNEAGIPIFYLADYLEQSPLGKAEWMIALGEIVGERAAAQQRFNEIVPKYEAVKQLAANSARRQPLVMLNTPYGDSWFMPGHGSYQVKLIEDAGGKYIYDDAPADASTVAVDMESAYLMTAKADVWINVGDFAGINALTSALPKMAGTPVVKRGDVYSNTARTTPCGGNDYYESAIVNPHLVLRDLVKIFHPEAVAEEFTYYRQLK